MNVKLIKVVVIIILLRNSDGRSSHSKHTHVFVDSSDEANHSGNQSTNSSIGSLDSRIGTVKRLINALPSPTEILHYGKQALIGVPEEIASKAKQFLCSRIVNLNDIVKEYQPQSKDVNFEFLTQDRENVTIPLSTSQYLFNHPKFHMNWNVVLFVTGWNTNTTDETVSALYDAYRCRGGYNFVVVDTTKFVNSMYAWSEFSTEPVGELIGDAIKNLTRYVPYERIYLIGNGIGAHIAGVAGRHFTKLSGNAITRITGLDPTRPCFSESDRSNGLQRGDALFVDIIHSNAAMWGHELIGDADFYPNGPNIIQHGCWSTSCSINHAYQYYAKTIYPGNEYLFNATKCESFSLFRLGNGDNDATPRIPLGISTPSWARGKYYLTLALPNLSVPDKTHCYD